MTYFIRNGDSYMVTSAGAVDIKDRLPAGTYMVKFDKFRGFFLEVCDSFDLPKKMYGNTLRHAKRIVDSFNDRKVSTGILLTGEKGSGKTLLAKKIAMDCIEQDIPCLIVNTDFHGDDFNKFIQDIEQPCVVFFDEFEKIFSGDKQQHILTLLDGVFSTHKLFLLTCNDKWKIDSHMRNRPGRIYYMIEFEGLEGEFIRDYCNDNLKNKDHIENLVRISSVFSKFNFDMLKAIVEEMNRYGETAQEVMAILNAKPEYSEKVEYEVKISINGVPVDKKNYYPNRWTGNPISDPLFFEESGDSDDKNPILQSSCYDGAYLHLTPADISKLDPDNGVFIYYKDNTTLQLTKVKKEKYNMRDIGAL